MRPITAAAALPGATTEPLSDRFEELFRTHSGFVYRTAYGITGNSQDAEDVVQALFLRLLARGLPPGVYENPKGYLYRAAVNLALNAVKQRARKTALHAAAADASLRLAVAHPFDADPDSERRRQLLTAIEQLNPRSVEMLILRYVHELTEAEIGKLLGTSRGVVAVTLFRARRRLKKLSRAAGERK